MKNLIAQGIARKLIRFEDNEKYIVYIHQNKRRNFDNPEEKVQADAFLTLVIDYQYPVGQIWQFVSVQMGSDTREADMIVYDDALRLKPLIVVECKKQDVTELEFQRAADQCFSYAVAEGAKYVWTTSGLKDAYYQVPADKPKARITVSDIPQFGIKKLAIYKYAYGGGSTPEGQKLQPLTIVTQDELTARFKQAHQALWGGGELNPSEAFDELDKLIFCKIWDERKPRKQGQPYDFQIFALDTEEETNTALHTRMRALYEEGRKKDPEVFKDDIRLRASKIRVVVGYLQDINLSDTDLDSKGRAFETFMGSFFRGDFGQYFTPRPIVKFIVDVLPITHESRVLDTSCGSGGFLLHALDKVRFEADSYYPDQIAMPSEGRPEGAQHFRHWHDFAEKNLFGIEINEQIARTAKMNMIIHDDGHTNVAAADGLLPPDELARKTGNTQFKANSFDFIITNPPFGSSVRQAEQAYFHNYRLAIKGADWLNPKSKAASRPAQDTEILFIEQCHTYLREGGYLAVVIPDGILTNSSLQYVRDQIESLYRIVAVISMPQTAFAATGAGVKSSVLFLRKHSQQQTKRIEDLRQRLQDEIKRQQQLEKQLTRLEAEKKDTLKRKTGFAGADAGRRAALQLVALREQQPAEKIDIEDTPAYAAWKKEVSDQFADRVDAIKFAASQAYEAALRQGQDDYDIFMAIAETIGYDSTGNPTKKNDLIGISVELLKFIQSNKFISNESCFIKSLDDIVTYQRWDPLFHQFNVFQFAAKHSIRFLRLGTLTKYIRTGFAAGKSDQEMETGTGVIQIRPTNINEDRDLIFDRNVYLPFALIQEYPKDILERGEVLFNNTNSQDLVGKTTYFDFDGDYFCSNHITRIATNIEKLDPKYLTYILNAYQRMKIFYRMCVNWNNQSGINADALKNLLVPVPEMKEQKRIVAKLCELEVEAATLRQQAKQKLDDAKSQVEKLILGSP
ncbi:MAG: N-6 DNA methylase [Rhodoferax sp.]|jgi:type I restriction-modification system DNA methylase subunit|nr:N-6 DNA methylase [Rhodoferax sp.]